MDTNVAAERNSSSVQGLYDKLEDRCLMRDQKGASDVYYDLVRAGRPLTEIVAEGVRIHAPYTHVPYHERIDDGYPNFVNNDHCLLSARATINLNRDAAGASGDAADGADHLVHPDRPGYLEPEDRQGARPLHAASRQSRGRWRRRRRRWFTGRIRSRSRRTGPLKERLNNWMTLVHRGQVIEAYRSVPRPDGEHGRPQGSAGGDGVRRLDRRAGPDAVQPLLHDRPQGVSRALDGRDRQRHWLGQRRITCSMPARWISRSGRAGIRPTRWPATTSR